MTDPNRCHYPLMTYLDPIHLITDVNKNLWGGPTFFPSLHSKILASRSLRISKYSQKTNNGFSQGFVSCLKPSELIVNNLAKEDLKKMNSLHCNCMR